jgi:hypothetical protein
VKDPAELTLTEVAGALRRRTFSSTELTRWMLERIGRWQPVINAFVRVEEDDALAAAKRADRALARGKAKGALYGVPLAHKDMYYIKGKLSECGSIAVRTRHVAIQHRGIAARRIHVAVGRRGAVAVKSTAVVRPVRPWVQQPYYGAVFDGVTLGAVITANAVPTSPSVDLCWYWWRPCFQLPAWLTRPPFF